MLPFAPNPFGDELLLTLTKLMKTALARPQELYAPSAAGPATKRKPLDSALDPYRMRECDEWLAGWFPDDASLYPGFDIAARDIVLNAGIEDPKIKEWIGRRGARCRDIPIQRGETIDGATRILCLDNLGTASDPARVCADLAAAGRSGARYLVAAPSKSHADLHSRLAPKGGPAIRGYDRSELRKLLTDAGLQPVHEASDGFYWSMCLAFLWRSRLAPGASGRLPEAWAGTWARTLAGRDGAKILAAMNELSPSRHVIVATKGGDEQPTVGPIPTRSWPSNWTLDRDVSVDREDPWQVSRMSEVFEGWSRASDRQLAPGFLVSEKDHVLDFGCGDGDFAEFCVESGARIVLADIDAAALERNRARVEAAAADPQVETIVTDSGSLPADADTFTRLICTEVLEHVEDPAPVLAELFRVGQKDALYLFSVPAWQSEAVQKHVAHSSYFERPNHIRIFSESAFRDLIERSGFEILRYYSDGFFRSFMLAMLWQTERWIGDRDHSLSLWARTWRMVMESPGGIETATALNDLFPCRQVIIARKK